MTPAQQINRASANHFAAALAEMERQEERQEAINERANALLAPGAQFDSLNVMNVSEALGNPEGKDQEDMAQQIEAALREERFEEVGRVLHSLSWAYWEAAAQERARAELERQAQEVGP